MALRFFLRHALQLLPLALVMPWLAHVWPWLASLRETSCTTRLYRQSWQTASNFHAGGRNPVPLGSELPSSNYPPLSGDAISLVEIWTCAPESLGRASRISPCGDIWYSMTRESTLTHRFRSVKWKSSNQGSGEGMYGSPSCSPHPLPKSAAQSTEPSQPPEESNLFHRSKRWPAPSGSGSAKPCLLRLVRARGIEPRTPG